jgi:hypothetical protein
MVRSPLQRSFSVSKRQSTEMLGVGVVPPGTHAYHAQARRYIFLPRCVRALHALTCLSAFTCWHVSAVCSHSSVDLQLVAFELVLRHSRHSTDNSSSQHELP